MDDEVRRKLAGICSALYAPIMQMPNVIGIGVGNKYVKGKDTGQLCLQVYVTKKMPSAFLAGKASIPKTYYNMPTDVIETGMMRGYAATPKLRPVEFGCSIGLAGVDEAGTAGALVKNSSDKFFILSNNHVLGRLNQAKKGDHVLQPAQLDGGKNPQDMIAKVTKFIPLRFLKDNKVKDSSPVNTVDCAIAEVIDRETVLPRVRKIGEVKGITSPVIGMQVQKTGRTTGFTVGSITGINATVLVSYEKGNALFINQIVSTPMAKAGDSGSLLLDQNSGAVGLLFAGSDTETLFNPINTVLSSLNVALVMSETA